MSGARTHGSLNDEEVNGAAWAAGRGAVVGAAKVSTIQHCSRRKIEQMKIERSGVQNPKSQDKEIKLTASKPVGNLFRRSRPSSLPIQSSLPWPDLPI